MIKAKTVIPDRYWILKQNDAKIGSVEVDEEGFQLNLSGRVTRFKTLQMLEKSLEVQFEKSSKPDRSDEHSVHGYSTHGRAFNGMYDVRRSLPLFTTSLKSKSWFAAGWYQIQQRRKWHVVHCPKLIALERYPYRGPFKTMEEAR